MEFEQEQETRVFRPFQLHYAPGAFGAFVTLGSFMPFVTDSCLLVVASWLWLGVMCYIYKPFSYLLLVKRRRLLVFLFLLSVSLFSPILLRRFSDSPLLEFIGAMMIPVGSIAVGFFVFLVYSPENLRREGWSEEQD